MKYSPQTDKIMAALSLFQGEMTNPPRDADNPFFKSKYTQLDTMIDHARPILTRHGLAVSQLPCSGPDGVGVITILCHASGQYIESDPYYLKLSKQDAQAGGSAITYARRYAFASILGISSDSDDDGNSASGKKDDGSQPKGTPSSARLDSDVICPSCNQKVMPVQCTDGKTMLPHAIMARYGMCSDCTKARKQSGAQS